MKRLLSILMSAIISLSLGIHITAEENTKTEYSQLFEKDKIIDIKIDIDEADLADMRAYPQNEEYHSADITVDGITVENSGIRTKGNMTLSSVARSDSERYSYRIKFNKYVKGRKLLGLNELCLNDGYSDASYMREYLHYEILRELGMNTPETAFCNVYINDEFAGFYLAVEALDSSFVETEFDDADNKGNLYKMEQGANLVYKEDENYTYAELKVGKDTELTGLKKFIKALNEMPDGENGDIEKYLDVESALKYIASNTVLCNYDSYNGGMCHNYYLYENADGVFTVVPWDFNMSFGGMGGNTNIGIDTPISGRNIDNLPLIKNLLAVPEYKELYYGYIKEIMSILEGFEDRVAELKAIIKPYVEKDTTAFYTLEQFEKATTKSTGESVEVSKEPEANTNPDEKGRNEHRDFGNGKSIIDTVAERLENLQAQFDGTAEKSTSTENGDGFGGGGRGNRPQNGGGAPDGMPQPPDGMPQPPEGMPEPPDGMPQPPEGMEQRPDGMQQPPDGMMPGGNGENWQNQRPPRPEGDFPGGGFDRQKNENTAIRVHVDGHIVSFAEEPVLKDGTTLVGYRNIMEKLGAEVTWNESDKTITTVKDDTTIVLTIGSDTAYVNGTAQTLLKAPEIINGSTMIPVRFISEQLGMTVKWDQSTKLIEITSKK